MDFSKFTTRLGKVLVFALTLSLSVYAANVCDPASGSTCTQVSVLGSGANAVAAAGIRPITKSTYRAGTATAANGVVVAAANVAPFACIYGSASKTVIVQRMYLSGASLTAVQYASYVVAKYSTAVSAGTATALTAVPLDSNSAAATVTNLNVYTAAPTAGTLVGTVSVKRTLLQATTAAAAGIPDVIEFDFRTMGSETSGIYLRGTGQGVCVNFGAAPASAVTLSFTVEWTEQSTSLEP